MEWMHGSRLAAGTTTVGTATGMFALLACGLNLAAASFALPAAAAEGLALDPPRITELFLPKELDKRMEAMSAPEPAPAGERAVEQVQVEGARLAGPPPGAPRPWPGIAAPIWAVLNPADAWRIFLPWLPEQAAALFGAPDATDTGLTPAALTGDVWPYDPPPEP